MVEADIHVVDDVAAVEENLKKGFYLVVGSLCNLEMFIRRESLLEKISYSVRFEIFRVEEM